MKILIADDHGIVRQGLKSLIQNSLNMEVAGETVSTGYTPDLLSAAVETAQSEWAGLSGEPDWDAEIVG